jgi:serine protease Do
MPSISTGFQTIQQAIVQIATPECTGMGIIWVERGIIITSQHLVEGASEVVISNSKVAPQLARVLFTDDIHDLAFVELSGDFDAPKVEFSQLDIQTGDTVFALTKKIKSGQITKPIHSFFDIDYIQTDISIDTEYTGTPLMSETEGILGIYSGLLQYGMKGVGYALPTRYIFKTYEEYIKGGSDIATRCRNCMSIVTNKSIQAESCCHNCKEVVELPNQFASYEPQGISRTIEELIEEIGYEPALTRRGPNNWALIQGSATIYLAYYEPRGYILGDAFLCKMPEDKETINRIYEFLLRQNYLIKGLTFSIYEDDIVLSLIIYDRHLNNDTAVELLQNLLERADYYDNVLVEELGAIWK